MTPQELWNKVRDHYGSDLGISSEDDYKNSECQLTSIARIVEFLLSHISSSS